MTITIADSFPLLIRNFVKFSSHQRALIASSVGRFARNQRSEEERRSSLGAPLRSAPPIRFDSIRSVPFVRLELLRFVFALLCCCRGQKNTTQQNTTRHNTTQHDRQNRAENSRRRAATLLTSLFASSPSTSTLFSPCPLVPCAAPPLFAASPPIQFNSCSLVSSGAAASNAHCTAPRRDATRCTVARAPRRLFCSRGARRRRLRGAAHGAPSSRVAVLSMPMSCRCRCLVSSFAPARPVVLRCASCRVELCEPMSLSSRCRCRAIEHDLRA